MKAKNSRGMAYSLLKSYHEKQQSMDISKNSSANRSFATDQKKSKIEPKQLKTNTLDLTQK